MIQNARTTWLVTSMLVAPLLTGCELVGDIFKAGVWTGVLVIGLLALLAVGILSFMRRT